MGTQFQRQKIPHAWGPEAVEADSHGNWKLTMSFPMPGCTCPRGFRRSPRPGPIEVCGRGSQRRILAGTVPCALNSALRGDHCPGVCSVPGASWDLTLTLTVPRTGTLHRKLSLPRSLTLQLSILLAPGCHLPWLIMADPLQASSPGVARLGPPRPGLSLTMAHHA